MPFGIQVAGRLARLRRGESVPQQVVAEALGLSISGVSRLERGLRHLRVDQLVAWAGALGQRVEIVVWKPTVRASAAAYGHAGPAGLDEEHIAVLAEVAAALPHLPEPVRRSLLRKMREWKSNAGGAERARA